MRKKNKLYTVNKFNKPLFVPEENVFDWGGLANTDYNNQLFSNNINNSIYKNAKTQDDVTEAYKKSTNAFGISKEDNPFSKGNMQGGLKAMAGTGIGSAALGAVGDLVGGAAFKGISGGLSSGAGSAINSIGSTAGKVVGKFNPVLGAAIGAASGLVGGVANALIGTGVDQEKLNAAKEGTTALNNFSSNAGSLDDIKGPQAVANVQDAYSSGLLNKGWAEKRNRELKEARKDAALLADRSILNNTNNLMADQLNDELANYSAFGGPLDMGAINYDFMTDYLIAKNKKADNNSQMTNLFAGTPSTMFAIGGDLQTNSADYSVGKVYDVSREEANRLKAMGYEFTVVS